VKVVTWRLVESVARGAVSAVRTVSASVIPAGRAEPYSFERAREYWQHVPRAQGGNPLDTSELASLDDVEVLETFDRELAIARRKRERSLGFHLAEQSLEGVASPRALDYGSGVGFYGFELLYRRTDALVTFADISQVNLAQVERIGRLRGVGDRVSTAFVTEPDASNLTFEQPFDLIVSMGVLHHTPYAGAIVEHLSGFLRSGGIFEAMLYNDRYLRREQRRAGRRLSKSSFGARTDPRVGELTNPYSEPYDEAKARSLFAGLEFVDVSHPEPEYDTYRFRKL
jgi:SAM-dependent methyltransferase